MTATSLNPVLQLGSQGKKVQELQQLLKTRLPGAAGYHNLAVDGVFGPVTQSAVRDFQSFVFLVVDGIVGPKTWKALYAGTPVDMPILKRGSRGEAVKTVQTVLKELRYYTGNVDGDFGMLTETAVKAFQQRLKLAVDGVVGSLTWNQLSETYVGYIFM